MQIRHLSASSASQPRPARPAVGRPSPVAAPTAVNPEAQRLAERPLPPEPLPRRPQPAAMLHAMFEQMGGAATSVWKGMHVNTVV